MNNKFGQKKITLISNCTTVLFLCCSATYASQQMMQQTSIQNVNNQKQSIKNTDTGIFFVTDDNGTPLGAMAEDGDYMFFRNDGFFTPARITDGSVETPDPLDAKSAKYFVADPIVAIDIVNGQVQQGPMCAIHNGTYTLISEEGDTVTCYFQNNIPMLQTKIEDSKYYFQNFIYIHVQNGKVIKNEPKIQNSHNGTYSAVRIDKESSEPSVFTLANGEITPLSGEDGEYIIPISEEQNMQQEQNLSFQQPDGMPPQDAIPQPPVAPVPEQIAMPQTPEVAIPQPAMPPAPEQPAALPQPPVPEQVAMQQAPETVMPPVAQPPAMPAPAQPPQPIAASNATAEQSQPMDLPQHVPAAPLPEQAIPQPTPPAPEQPAELPQPPVPEQVAMQQATEAVMPPATQQPPAMPVPAQSPQPIAASNATAEQDQPMDLPQHVPAAPLPEQAIPQALETVMPPAIQQPPVPMPTQLPQPVPTAPMSMPQNQVFPTMKRLTSTFMQTPYDTSLLPGAHKQKFMPIAHQQESNSSGNVSENTDKITEDDVVNGEIHNKLRLHNVKTNENIDATLLISVKNNKKMTDIREINDITVEYYENGTYFVYVNGSKAQTYEMQSNEDIPDGSKFTIVGVEKNGEIVSPVDMEKKIIYVNVKHGSNPATSAIVIYLNDDGKIVAKLHMYNKSIDSLFVAKDNENIHVRFVNQNGETIKQFSQKQINGLISLDIITIDDINLMKVNNMLPKNDDETNHDDDETPVSPDERPVLLKNKKGKVKKPLASFR